MRRRRVFWVVLFLLLAAELIVLTPPSDIVARVELAGRWGWLLSKVLYQIRPALIAGLLAVVFLSWPTLRDQFRTFLSKSEGRLHSPIPWLAAHVALAGVLLTARLIVSGNSRMSLAEAHAWVWGWAIILILVFVTWSLAAMPPRFWINWFARSRGAFVAGAVFGATADFLGGSTEALWWPLQRMTFRVVVFLLRFSGQSIIVNSSQFTVGTPHFAVQIWAQCSGLEGMGLMIAFVAGYLCLFRRELNFPQALVLLPVGAVAIWVMNAVRITALILIGNFDPGVGFRGFHSIAGWLFFNLVACGLIWTSWRFRLFVRPEIHAAGPTASNPAAFYLVPLLAIVGVSMVTTAFAGGFEVLYPLRVLAAICAFWFYRRELAAMRWSTSWFALALGGAVFLLWISLAHSSARADAASGGALDSMPAYLAGGWLFFRVAGSIVTVPLAEELAFRGYLIRKLVSPDFVSVSPSQFTWLSFLGSSIIFGVLHGEWLAGVLAGMIFAIAVYRRGLLSDAVFAHVTANGLLSAYTLLTRDWSLWS
ncbi:MAG: exosortase E/protease, VPEID-CTERM system [Deltaproteobacteria bacterium]|nr:exosortase E/protease, VPEID-CTERM system [Deltaproteobacteria bacterium]